MKIQNKKYDEIYVIRVCVCVCECVYVCVHILYACMCVCVRDRESASVRVCVCVRVFKIILGLGNFLSFSDQTQWLGYNLQNFFSILFIVVGCKIRLWCSVMEYLCGGEVGCWCVFMYVGAWICVSVYHCMHRYVFWCVCWCVCVCVRVCAHQRVW